MSYAHEIAKKYNITPNKKLGQNFLQDESVISEIVTMSDVKGSTVLEIGPGTGNMTRVLLNSNAAKVIAVEFDQQCVDALTELKNQYDNLEVIQADALNFKEEECGTNIKIVANLPYNIGTALLLKWIHKRHLFASITIMLQKEVIDRIVAVPRTKNYCSLSVLCQSLCNVEKLFDVPKESFWPMPTVTSSVVRLIPNQKYSADLNILNSVLKTAFAQRRKILINNLKKITDKDLKTIFLKLGINLNSRAEELSVDQFHDLVQEL
jgi:16S rRNA (adenine1518-N6/adenine1519-N6)-dimethyltransferase